MSSRSAFGDAESIEVVLARLAPVDVDALSVAGCDRWLADAARVAGWLTVMRLDVDQARAHKAWAGSTPPGSGDSADDDDDAEGPQNDAPQGGGPDRDPVSWTRGYGRSRPSWSRRHLSAYSAGVR